MPTSFGSLIPLNIVVPSGYGYVGLAATSALWLSLFQGFYQVNGARKAAKIPYPQLYAEKAQAETSKEAYRFNCVQRAHANLLETLPVFLFSVLFAGLKHPKVATALGFTWVAGRAVYAIGYGTGVPKARVKGALPAMASLLGLLGTATYTAVQFVQQAGGF